MTLLLRSTKNYVPLWFLPNKGQVEEAAQRAGPTGRPVLHSSVGPVWSIRRRPS